MHPVLLFLAGILALIWAYRVLNAYRFVRGTLADTLLLALMTGAAMVAGYLLS